MRSSPETYPLLRYGYAILAVAAALIAARALRSFDLEGFLFVVAVAAAVWIGGRGPGLLAVLLSVVALRSFFIAPVYSGAMPHTVLYFALFSTLAILITVLGESRRRAQRRLVEARDELEERVRERTAELERSTRQLRELETELARVTRVTTLGEVTASLGHELNQPLAAIVNNAGACLGMLPSDRPELDEVREALGDIRSDAERASAVIERVRDLARRSPPARVPLRPAAVVADVFALTAAAAAARGVRLDSELGEDLPLVLGDRVELQQVLLNLVVNAMDAMNGTPEAERRIVVRGLPCLDDDGADAVQIRVVDRGCGLDATKRDALFEAFYTTKPGGMGMGLAISRSILEVHGGRLWAEANPEGGATFAFQVPVAGPA